MAQPIVTERGDVHALVALEIPLQPVNAIMHSRVGMGKTRRHAADRSGLPDAIGLLPESERAIDLGVFQESAVGEDGEFGDARCSRTECSRN